MTTTHQNQCVTEQVADLSVLMQRLRDKINSDQGISIADVDEIAICAALTLQGTPEEPTAWMAGRELFLSHDAIPAHLLPPLGNPTPLYIKPATQQGAAQAKPSAQSGRSTTAFDDQYITPDTGDMVVVDLPSDTTTNALNEAVTHYWLTGYVNRAAHLCGLCGNRGVIDTRGRAVSYAGVHAGGLHYCICPNGQAHRANAVPLERLL